MQPGAESLMEDTPALAWIKDAEGRYIYANATWQRVFGRSFERMIGCTDFDLFPHDVAQAVRDNDAQVRASGRPHHYVEQDRRADGLTYQWLSIKFPGRDGQVCGFAVDITEQRRAEAKLRISEDALRAVVEHASDGIFVSDAQGVVLEVNQAGAAMLGRTRDQIVGSPSEAFIQPHEQPALDAHLRELERGRTLYREWHLAGPDGQRITAEISASRLPDGRNLAIARDVTERKAREARERRAEASLRQAQKLEAVGTLAGGIAHDFNNLLAIIQGNAELMDEALGPDHELAEPLADLRVAARRAKELVTRILTFSRQRETQLQRVVLPTTVDEVVRLLRSTIPARVDLTAVVAPDAPAVLADPTQLHQLVVNLVTNAWQALGAGGGRVTIEVDRAERHAELGARELGVLRVRDDGPGIDPAVQARIFEPFFTTKGSGGGTGLGLSVVHGIVRAHGGALSVDSAPGQGATFSVYLPAAGRAETTTPPPAPSVARAQGAGERVLLVDDEEMLVKTVQRQLESLGYRVESFRDPTAALRVFLADPARFALVVTDHDMPGLSGIELAAQARARAPELPVVLMSGFLTEAEHAHAYQVGVGRVLDKPAGLDELAEALREARARLPAGAPAR